MTTAVAPRKAVGRKPGTRNKKFGLRVVEAKETLTIPLLQVDIECAEKVKAADVNDPANFLSCVIAQAVTRTCGAERVAIQRTIAYVAFPGDNVTRRYQVAEKSRKVLEAWDRGEHIVEGVELRLLPPNKKHTRRFFSDRNKARRAAGVHPKRDRAVKRHDHSDPLHGVVRNGNLVRWAA